MPPDRRTLRDIRDGDRAMKEYQRQVGQWAHWFRFNLAATTAHPVYDVGPQRVWYPPITVPVMIGEYGRAGQNFDDDGLYRLDSVHFVISKSAFFHTTMPDPDETGADHVNDRVGFDGTLFSVDSFQPRGRVAGYFWTISVDAHEVAQEDLDEDAADPMFAPYIVGP